MGVASRLELQALVIARKGTSRSRQLQVLPTAQAAKGLSLWPPHVICSDVSRCLKEAELTVLPGGALLVGSAMFLTNMSEVEDYFGITFKTIKARLDGLLAITPGTLPTPG